MHLADVDGMVTAVSQLLDPVGLIGRQPGFVTVDSVCVDVLARNDAVSGGATDGALNERVIEGDAAVCETIDVGCWNVFETETG